MDYNLDVWASLRASRILFAPWFISHLSSCVTSEVRPALASSFPEREESWPSLIALCGKHRSSMLVSGLIGFLFLFFQVSPIYYIWLRWLILSNFPQVYHHFRASTLSDASSFLGSYSLHPYPIPAPPHFTNLASFILTSWHLIDLWPRDNASLVLRSSSLSYIFLFLIIVYS